MAITGKQGTRKFLRQAALLGAMVTAWVAARAETDAGDMAVLEDLRQGLVGNGAEALGWGATDDACAEWKHLQCDSGGAVTGIALAGRGLKGRLPASLCKLRSLRTLQLQRNSLSGPLPSLARMMYLETVFLDNNEFTFVPPNCFKWLPSLVVLNVDSNSQLAAWLLPADFATSRLLQNLSLTNTNLVGEVPAFLATLPCLQVLRLAYNRLSGIIPAAYSQSNLRVLELNNQLGPAGLSGGLEVFSRMQSLTQLWLHVNQFFGTIPATLAIASPSLSSLSLNDNQLVGPIPSNFRLLPFHDLHLQNNFLDGPIPAISVSPDGQFTFFSNRFCRPIPGAACSPPVSALLDFLASVDYPITLASSWGGNDPCSSPWIGITCSARGSVSVLNLANSGLSGSISANLANLTSLAIIKLNGNALTGSIPDSLTSLKFLRLLDVRDNQLSGPIPLFGREVQVLASGNPISSRALPSPKRKRIPSSPALPPPSSSPAGSPPVSPALAPAPESSAIAIAPAPPSITIPAPSITIPGAPNTFTSGGSIPAPGPNDVILSGLQHRRSSSISGAAAMLLIVGAAVVLLFTPLGVFLICRKQRKRFLQVQSPNAVVISSQDPADADVVKLVVSGRHESAGSDTAISGPSNSAGNNEVQVIETGNLVISVEVLRNVTDNFSEPNVLGRGGFGVVYKGELEDGTKVAVKRMEEAALRSTGLREFQAEIGVLSKVRHRHLVALLGYCIGENEKLLVYEFMPQGALSKHLFDRDKKNTPVKPLDWKKRLVIALDVARGMDYLHSFAHKSFIHRDLKSSNILLDDDFRAKISDFGLVKLASENGRSVETRIAGTFGYLAPEYAVTGRVMTKSDIFSFGVVLMELITGRRALDETQLEENLHLVTCFRRANASKQSLRDAIDKALKQTITEEEQSIDSILKVADLASQCTAMDAKMRPDMGDAVSILAPLVAEWKNPDAHDNKEDNHTIAMAMDSASLLKALKLWQASDKQSPINHEADGYGGGSLHSQACDKRFDFASNSSYKTEAFLDDSVASLPCRPTDYTDSFNSSDCR